MTANQAPEAGTESTTQVTAQLQRFHGRMSPGICLDSGHCFWVIKWDRTPTSIGSYSEIWIITPDGDRLLYADPREAGPFVEKYHDFDRTHGATITWDRIDDAVVKLQVSGEDNTTLELRIELGTSPATRLLNSISAVTPSTVLRTSIGQTISNLSLASVMDVNGLKIAGTTETQEPYRFEAERIQAIEGVSAVLNGEDLGGLSTPDRPIDFGDIKTPDDPFLAVADVFLRPPNE